MSQHSNPFDSIGQQPEFSDEDNKHFEKLDNLIHQTFVQCDAGAELLEHWREALMMTPTVEAGADLITVGQAEGIKTFIRNIILTIRKVEQ